MLIYTNLQYPVNISHHRLSPGAVLHTGVVGVPTHNNVIRKRQNNTPCCLTDPCALTKVSQPVVDGQRVRFRADSRVWVSLSAEFIL